MVLESNNASIFAIDWSNATTRDRISVRIVKEIPKHVMI